MRIMLQKRVPNDELLYNEGNNIPNCHALIFIKIHWKKHMESASKAARDLLHITSTTLATKNGGPHDQRLRSWAGIVHK